MAQPHSSTQSIAQVSFRSSAEVDNTGSRQVVLTMAGSTVSCCPTSKHVKVGFVTVATSSWPANALSLHDQADPPGDRMNLLLPPCSVTL
jgi:hypothetical protein